MTAKDPSEATQQALERTQAWLERLKYALDQSSIVAITDVRGRITYVNDKFCEISRYSQDELLGQDHRIINSGLHPKTVMRDLWRTIAQGGVWRGELRNRAKDGSIYWVDTTIVPLFDARGKPEQYLSIRTDVTARKRMESLLRAQETMAQLGQMAAVIAHEVRNPLAGISAAIQVIAQRLPHGTPEVAILNETVARIAGLDEVVSGLLEFARPRPLVLRECSLSDTVERALRLVSGHPHHASTRFEQRGPDVRVMADAESVGRAVLNLLMNAAQAIESEARGADAPGRVEIELADAGDEAVIDVTDDGPGIAPELAPTVFQPFVTTKTAGTGLGLAIVKSTIENHGGSIELSSVPGRTRFSVRLPKGGPRPD